jgi:ubiquinone biosynthesis protein
MSRGIATRPSKGKAIRKRRYFERYREIAMILIKYRLDDVIHTLGLQRFMPIGHLPSNPFHKEHRPEAERARLAIEELGTTFIKVGQILSTRTDLLSAEFILELSKLQNSLKPFPFEVVQQAIQEELGKPVSDIFAEFNPQPIGVASIGQAHAATLLDGTEVVVKVRKPGVVEQVSEDIEILNQLAASAADRWQDAQYDIVGIVKEIGDTLMAEMDYRGERQNAENLANFFKGDRTVHIPRIFKEYSTSRVITLQRVKGIRISDFETLKKAGVDRSELAKRSINIWLKMFFEGSYFHADPHPGNLFVQPDGTIGLIDFGMVGVVDDEIREHLCQAIRAILEKDPDLLIDSLIDMGAVRHDASREVLRSKLKRAMAQHSRICKLDHDSCSGFDDLIDIVRGNQVQLPSNTFLLLKTMTMVHGMGRGLDPDLDMMDLMEPAVKRILIKKYSPISLAGKVPMAATEYAILGLGLPQRLNRLLKSAERGDLQIRATTEGMERKLDQIYHLGNRLLIGLVLSALIIGVALVVLAFKLGQ